MQDILELKGNKSSTLLSSSEKTSDEKKIAVLPKRDQSQVEDSIKINFSLNESDFYNYDAENSSSFLQKAFNKRDFNLSEKWDFTESIQGKIVSISETLVYLDCLIDKESMTFQHRAFPIILFKDFLDLKPEKLIMIKTKTKAGAIRIDFYQGDGMIDKKLFEHKVKWDLLIDSNLDRKLKTW